MMKNILLFALLATHLFFISPVFAAEDKQPVEISAEETLEWDRAEQRYIARGDVEVKQGELSVFSDLLMAYYSDDKSKKSQGISRIEMESNVRVVSPPYTAYGDNGVYDITKGKVVLTGKYLRIETPDEIIKARDSLEYDVNTQKFIARGKAKIVRGLHVLNADIIVAKFEKNSASNGSLQLTNVVANGNVVISTPTEKIYGKKAIYNTQTEIAIMTGNIRIEQGKNILKGTKATLNMKTGISQVFAGKQKDGKKGRVTGVFYPE